MANGIVAQFDGECAVIRRPIVSRSLGALAALMALVLFLSAMGVQGGHDAGPAAIVLLVLGLAQTVFATRALRGGVIAVKGGEVNVRTLLRSASVTRDVAKFEVVQRRGRRGAPYCALLLLGGGKPILLREFSTGMTNKRAWLDSLADQLNAMLRP